MYVNLCMAKVEEKLCSTCVQPLVHGSTHSSTHFSNLFLVVKTQYQRPGPSLQLETALPRLLFLGLILQISQRRIKMKYAFLKYKLWKKLFLICNNQGKNLKPKGLPYIGLFVVQGELGGNVNYYGSYLGINQIASKAKIVFFFFFFFLKKFLHSVLGNIIGSVTLFEKISKNVDFTL